MQKIIILSGGFDPVHIGHIRMFREAKERSDIVIVGANSDEWLNRKKGKAFMPLVERIEILKAIQYIDYVWTFDDEDNTACKLIEKVIQKFSNRAELEALGTEDISFHSFTTCVSEQGDVLGTQFIVLDSEGE